MSITRINSFHARERHAADLRQFLIGILPQIRTAPGCQSCELLQDHTDPARMVILEIWDDIESHRASLRQVSPESIEEARHYLVEPPSGAYYS